MTLPAALTRRATGGLSRRALLGVLGAVGTAAALTGCGGPVPTGATESSAAGPWSWTDALGQKIDLPTRPTRIAAYGDAAAALINFGITPVAIFHYSDPTKDATFERIDLSGIEVIGTAYGEISLEALAAAAPELIVTTTYASSTVEQMYGFKDAAQLATVREIAPVIGVAQTGTALDVITANEKLVGALGIDTTAGKIADDRRAFEQASAELREAARSGLTVVPLYAEQAGGVYYAKAPDDPALSYYASLGVEFVEVGGKDYYWHQVSWENAGTYVADLVLYSLRNSLTPEQLDDQPTFAQLPAARAKQLHPWKFTSMDYPSQTAYLRELATWLTSDRKVT